MKIVVTPTKSQIEGDLPSKVKNKIDQALCHTDKKYYIIRKVSNWDGKTRFFSKVTNKFPTGLLPDVVKILKENKVDFKLTRSKTYPLYIKPIKDYHNVDFVILDMELRPIQRKVLNRMLEKRKGVVWCATNFGKTNVSAILIRALNYPQTLFLVNEQDLLYQTYGVFKNEAGADLVGIIGDGSYNPRKVTVATVQTLYSRTKKFRDIKENEDKATYKVKKIQHNKRRVETLEYLASIELLLLDECHNATSFSWYKIAMNCKSAWWRFGLSGTPLTDNEVRNIRLKAVTGKVIARVRNKLMIEKGYSAKPTIHIVPVPKIKKYDTWFQAYKHNVVESEFFNTLVDAVVNRFTTQGKKVLCLVNRQKQGYILEESMKPIAKFIYGKTSHKDRQKAVDDFVKGKKRVLIASKIFYHGIDIHDINVLVNVGGMQAWWTLLQKVGRALREKPKGQKNVVDVVDFYMQDKGFLEKHSKIRLKAYKDEEFEIKIMKGLKV